MDLHSELSVLSRAVAYENLSSAAGPVGLSQPQLSRIVSRIEGELGVVLLDRTAKRKSGWTPTAQRLAELFAKSSRHFQEQVQRLVQAAEPRELRVAALEGMAVLASAFCARVFQDSSARLIELNLHDLTELEDLVLKHEVDLAFTSREPGRRKYRYLRRLGSQTLEEQGNERGKGPLTQIQSPFEYRAQAARGRRETPTRIIVSNSLFVRRHWLETYGGRAVIPSPVRPGSSSSAEATPVILIGLDHLSPGFWARVSSNWS